MQFLSFIEQEGNRKCPAGCQYVFEFEEGGPINWNCPKTSCASKGETICLTCSHKLEKWVPWHQDQECIEYQESLSEVEPNTEQD
jgi:hypothetical protein